MEEGSLGDGGGGSETCSGGAWWWGWVGAISPMLGCNLGANEPMLGCDLDGTVWSGWRGRGRSGTIWAGLDLARRSKLGVELSVELRLVRGLELKWGWCVCERSVWGVSDSGKHLKVKWERKWLYEVGKDFFGQTEFYFQFDFIFRWCQTWTRV